MTSTYCRGCGETVHITHGDDDCPAEDADLETPPGLREPDRGPVPDEPDREGEP